MTVGLEHKGGHFKFTQEQIEKIRMLRRLDPETYTYTKLCAEFHTTRGNISKIINRKNRKQKVDIQKDGVSLFEETHPSRE